MSPVLHVLVSPGTRKFVSLTTLPGAVSCGAQLGHGSSPAQGRQREAIQTMFLTNHLDSRMVMKMIGEP